MTESLLQQFSAEREALVASVIPRAVAVAVAPHRVLSGIHWRGTYVITAAETLRGADRVRVIWPETAGSEESAEGEIVASDLTTDVAVIRTGGARASEMTTRESLRL